MRAIVQLFAPVLVVSLGASLLVVSAAEERNAEAADVVALTESARKSVVVVTHYSRDGKQDGVGAGFVVSKDGLIATCLHVIGEARPITVELSDGRRFSATEVFASDRKLDLAVVRIEATNLPVLKLGDSDALKQGAPVIAMGNPVGLQHSVVQGIVSAKREFDGLEMIQLAIPIESGNSGGPLLDAKGRVQGLLNMKSAITANLGFAVPVNALKMLIDHPNPMPINRWLTLGALSPKEWTPLMGARWSRKAGRIEVDGLGTGFGGRSLCLSEQPVPSPPYEIGVTVKLDDESGAAGLAFESDGSDKHYGFYRTAGQMRLTRFDGPNVFSWTILKEFKTAHYRPGDWNAIKVRVETNRIIAFVNGERVAEATGESLRDGKVGLAKFRDTKAQFKDFRVGKSIESRAEGVPSGSATVSERLRETTGKTDAELMASLESQPGAARPLLLERAQALDKEAQQMRRVATALHSKAICSALVEALQGKEEHIQLFRAALLVAKLDNAELEVEAYQNELTRMAEELKASLTKDADDKSKVTAVSKYLFTDNGFHGSRTDYYNRANSYMNEVMDDREGLPITLSVLYLELARLIGLTNVVGVPVPTHFMVSFRPTNGLEQLIDVFDNGKALTRAQAVELVADNVDSIGEEAFRPATKREIITRILRNLFGIAQRAGSINDAVRYLDAILALNPDSAPDRLSRARYEMQRGNHSAAKTDVQWLLDHESPGLDRERLMELFRSL